jgi:hypothetical protein
MLIEHFKQKEVTHYLINKNKINKFVGFQFDLY